MTLETERNGRAGLAVARILRFHQLAGDRTLTASGALVDEETRELRQAIDTGDQAAIAREACDVIITALGVLWAHNIDAAGALDLIAQANLRKLHWNGNALVVIRDDRGKVLKPPGWQPADIARLLDAA